MHAHTHVDETQWEAFCLSHPEANFLQSWNWGVFHERLGKTIVRIVLEDSERLVGVAQGVIEHAKRGTYLAVAGGPLVDWSDSAAVKTVFSALAEHARSAGCTFIRFRPQAEDTPHLRAQAAQLQALQAPMHLTADLTLQLDITQSEEALLAQMRKNTRGEIRKAERLGIRTEISQDPSAIAEFYQQQLIVAEKHHFVPFSEAFLTEQFITFTAANQAFLLSTYLEDQLLAQAFIIAYNKEAVYHYGVSTEANRKFPGAAYGQWAAIKEAQHRGCTRYNFWGVAPSDNSEHRFAGVSLFKRGFGGEEVAYLPAHDIPLSWLYWPTYVFERARHALRHL